MSDVVPHCPRCGSSRMRDVRETRTFPNGPDYVCVESNCQGVIFAPRDVYADANQFCHFGEGVYDIDGLSVVRLGEDDANDFVQQKYSESGIRQRKHVTGQ